MTNYEMAERAVEVLNRAFESDPEAISQLCKTRVPCNETLADDPTIQVLKTDDAYSLSIIGIINGICGTMKESSWGYVAANYSVVCPEHGVQDSVVPEVCPVEGCEHPLQTGDLEGFILLDER